MREFEGISRECFYGQLVGLHYTPSIRKIMKVSYQVTRLPGYQVSYQVTIVTRSVGRVTLHSLYEEDNEGIIIGFVIIMIS